MLISLRHLPILTILLILISVVISVISSMGDNRTFVDPISISSSREQFLPEIQAGELWRTVTPIFLHFHPLHLLLNMLWLWDLGSAIERVRSGWALLALILVMGTFSNLGQYLYSGPGFGGMSGVVYGLLGYIWMQGHFNPKFRVYLKKIIVIFMLIWFALCWTVLEQFVANMAHTVGLLIGIVWGFIGAKIETIKT